MKRKSRNIPGLAGRALAGSIVLVLASVSAADAAPSPTGDPGTAPRCQIHELPLPEGSDAAVVSAASPDGTTLYGFVPGAREVVVWKDGEITEILDMPSAPVDVNAHGAAVGGHLDEPTGSHAWVFENGKVRELPGDVTPHAINDDGLIVGSRVAPDRSSVIVPTSWQPGSDEPVDLQPRPSGEAYDVADDGTAVGTGSGGDGQLGFVWRQRGDSGPLPRPEGVPERASMSARAINGPWILGAADGTAVRWNLDSGQTDLAEGVEINEHSALNQRGWFVGTRGYDAVLAVDGEVTGLPGLGERYMHHPESLSADGTVIGGYATVPKAPAAEVPVYWTCA